MCSHQGQIVQEPGCETPCQGCLWTLSISHQVSGTDCSFTWELQRTGCTFSPNKTFSGTTNVPCDNNTKLTFHCDDSGTCPGYELKLIGKRCPTPPGGN